MVGAARADNPPKIGVRTLQALASPRARINNWRPMLTETS
jgi:hypothetical protein